MLNINLFGGPGTGKSTTAAGIFYDMKTNNHKIEYVQEYAKELTFGNDEVKLSDQILILGEQHHRMYRLKNTLDYVVHDSPFIMGLAYLNVDGNFPVDEYEAFVVAMFKSYDNLNIFLKRNTDEHKFQEYGRNQDLNDAIHLDNIIKLILNRYEIPFIEVEMDSDTVSDIISIVLNK